MYNNLSKSDLERLIIITKEKIIESSILENSTDAIALLELEEDLDYFQEVYALRYGKFFGEIK